jgi:hypothetical protein
MRLDGRTPSGTDRRLWFGGRGFQKQEDLEDDREKELRTRRRPSSIFLRTTCFGTQEGLVKKGSSPSGGLGSRPLEVQALKVARTGERRWKILNADKPPKPSKILNVVLTERNALR